MILYRFGFAFLLFTTIWLNAAPLAAQQFSSADIENAPICKGVTSETQIMLCNCLPGHTVKPVWGSGPYTGDSDICSAARHSGAISDNGGTVLVVIQPGQSSYSGSSKNGVSTDNWASYGTSFVVTLATASGNTMACGTLPDSPLPHSCSCPANAPVGSVWGSGPYTTDSNLCTAARHAGVLGKKGGTITVLRVQGLDSYRASTANGISTSNWGSYGASFVVNAN